jgi:hypothetical protein
MYSISLKTQELKNSRTQDKVKIETNERRVKQRTN